MSIQLQNIYQTLPCEMGTVLQPRDCSSGYLSQYILAGYNKSKHQLQMAELWYT